MKRLGFMLRGHRLVAFGSVALLVAAAGVVVYSGASFNYKTTNAANVFAAGTLIHSNSAGTGAILTVSNMKPGDSVATDVAHQVTITNTGTLPATISVDKGTITDTPGTNGGALSAVLKLKIEDVTGTAVTKYDGLLSAFTSTSFGVFNASDVKKYKFTVYWLDGGTPGSNTTGDNLYQGSSMSVPFTWTSVQ
jgi:hypothetical protein